MSTTPAESIAHQAAQVVLRALAVRPDDEGTVRVYPWPSRLSVPHVVSALAALRKPLLCSLGPSRSSLCVWELGALDPQTASAFGRQSESLATATRAFIARFGREDQSVLIQIKAGNERFDVSADLLQRVLDSYLLLGVNYRLSPVRKIRQPHGIRFGALTIEREWQLTNEGTPCRLFRKRRRHRWYGSLDSVSASSVTE